MLLYTMRTMKMVTTLINPRTKSTMIFQKIVKEKAIRDLRSVKRTSLITKLSSYSISQ